MWVDGTGASRDGAQRTRRQWYQSSSVGGDVRSKVVPYVTGYNIRQILHDEVLDLSLIMTSAQSS